jgi:hypothetical protein
MSFYVIASAMSVAPAESKIAIDASQVYFMTLSTQVLVPTRFYDLPVSLETTPGIERHGPAISSRRYLALNSRHKSDKPRQYNESMSV